MKTTNTTKEALVAAATPLFAAKGVHGVSVREIARRARVKPSLISYHFGGKDGLYAAVLQEQFAGLLRIAGIVAGEMTAEEKFASYVIECGVCFHCGSRAEFAPATASADRDAPECPSCLNNYREAFFDVSREKQ